MEDPHLRPSEELIKSAYDHIFNTGNGFSRLKDAALADRLLPTSPSDTFRSNIAGRSIAWKLFLMSEEPLRSSSSLHPTSLLDNLRVSRQKYINALAEKMKAPDGSYEEGFTLPGSLLASARQPSKKTENLENNNPLSLHNENPWTEWFASVELRKIILQDVERTFPDIEFFRDPEVQLQLSNILFLYSILNPYVGYRQGMHEVLAPLYYAVDYDSILPGAGSGYSEIEEICSRTWVAADAWGLFNSVMRGISKWYEWREPPPDSTPKYPSSSPFSNHAQITLSSGQLGIKPYIAPIVDACNNIQSNLLRRTDPLLWNHMQSTGVEPQIYGIRWLRLLFTREFNMRDAMKIWDGLFACDPTFELTQWVCVAMLIRIRNELIPSDYSGQLTVLLRYSSAQVHTGNATHHTSLLLRQALALQMSPTPSTGASLVMENRNMLNIALEVPAPPPAPRSKKSRGRQDEASDAPGRSADVSSHRHSRQETSHQLGLPEMIARGLLERGESLGINKTLMSAVSELRRNIPDLAASLIRSPNTSHGTFPLVDERPYEERPPWEPRTRFEMERDIAQLRSTNKRLGKSLEWIVDVLLQDETGVEDVERLQKKRREALESLSYIRDFLSSNATMVEEGRLVGEEETIKRATERERDATISRPEVPIVTVPPPAAPVPTDARKMMYKSPPSHIPSHVASAATDSSLHEPAGTLSNPTVAHNSSSSPPRNHIQSSFSGNISTLSAGALPRFPPPTSNALRRSSPGLSAGQRSHRSEVYQDPLGVQR